MRYPTLTASDGVELRVVDEHVERRDGDRWRKMTRRELLAYPKDGVEWEWLREHGVRRPSPPSRTGGGGLSAAERRARGLSYLGAWVPAPALAFLDEQASKAGVSRSAYLVRLIDAAAKRAKA